MSSNDSLDIQELRSTVAAKHSEVDGVNAFGVLLKHPDICWNDLLSCLQYPVIIGEQAAFRLHSLLRISLEHEGLRQDVEFWQKTLSERGIPLDQKIRDYRGSASK